jgi:hypothetical protein
MSDFLSRQANKISRSALAPVEAAGGRFLGLLGIGGVALLCLIATIIFLSVALDLWLSRLFDPIIGALGTAGFYFAVLLVCLLILWARGRKKKKTVAVKKVQASLNKAALDQASLDQASLDEAEAAARAQAAGLSANLEKTIAPFLAILQQSGMKREAVAVQLATEVSKEFGPFALVALAVAAGFLSERSLTKTKSPE